MRCAKTNFRYGVVAILHWRRSVAAIAAALGSRITGRPKVSLSATRVRQAQSGKPFAGHTKFRGATKPFKQRQSFRPGSEARFRIDVSRFAKADEIGAPSVRPLHRAIERYPRIVRAGDDDRREFQLSGRKKFGHSEVLGVRRRNKQHAGNPIGMIACGLHGSQGTERMRGNENRPLRSGRFRDERGSTSRADAGRSSPAD